MKLKRNRKKRISVMSRNFLEKQLIVSHSVNKEVVKDIGGATLDDIVKAFEQMTNNFKVMDKNFQHMIKHCDESTISYNESAKAFTNMAMNFGTILDFMKLHTFKSVKEDDK